jgi:predicted nucleotidyltransferase component of viral defense system
MTQPFIQEIFRKYQTSRLTKKDILREILQQSALLGLARHNFFEHAAFYGGTALRILYGLDRFSEDLDFSLLKPNAEFNFSPFLEGMKKEISSFGFHVELTAKEKESAISSAFVKANTLKSLLMIEGLSSIKGIHREEKITIKIEVDTNPPPGFQTEPKFVLLPTPFYILSYVPRDLFAGKMNAILWREWKNRVKGRDWYDLIWFLKNNIPVHLSHLAERMIQSGNLFPGETIDHNKLLELLQKRIVSIDWEQAKKDVKPFIEDPKQLDLWSVKFFEDLITRITTT